MKYLIFLFFITFFGCVSLSKDEQTQNLQSPSSVQSSINKSVESGYFSMGEWPEKQWWAIFKSDQLNALVVEALASNPTLQSVESRVEFARQTAKVTRSRLFPLLFFDADETWQFLSHNGLYRAFNPKIPINANLVDLTLSFTYEFDFWGKNRNLYSAAIGRNKAEEAEREQADLLTSTAVAQAFFALKTNLVRKELYRQLFEVRRNYFTLQQELYDKALLSKLSPLFSNESVNEAEKLIFNIDQEIATDKHLINILVGRGPDSPLDIDAAFPPLARHISLPTNLSIDLLSRRPDLMAQIWRVEALAHEVGAAKADFYPNINLRAFTGLESVFYGLLFNSDSFQGGLQPALSLPIFTAGSIRANIRAKKALFDQAINEYNALLLRSAQEVADLLALAESIFKQQMSQEKIVRDAESRFDLTRLRHRSGLDDLLAVYLVQDEWIQKQLANITLLYNQYLATIKLIKSLGGGYQSEYVPLKQEKTE